MLPVLAFADSNALCSEQSEHKSFLSGWNDDDNSVQILSSYNGSKFEVEEGRTAYKGDLNGDGNDDLIFEAYASEGSSKEMVNEILVQCKGFLVNVGGDYFSKVEVGALDGSTGFKLITAYNYTKNKTNAAPLDMKAQTSRVLKYNPEAKRYQ
jgi:hypothetical protein